MVQAPFNTVIVNEIASLVDCTDKLKAAECDLRENKLMKHCVTAVCVDF